MLNFKVIQLFAIGLISLCFSFSVFAAEDDKKTQIFFVNGVWNDTICSVTDSSDELELALSEVGLKPTDYGLPNMVRSRFSCTKDTDVKYVNHSRRVRPIWNAGNGKITDVLEVFAQQRVAGISVLLAAREAQFRFLSTLVGTPDPTAEANIRASINLVKNKVRLELQQERTVLLVAHSQGTIVVNEAVTELIAENPKFEKSIGIVAVGAATNKKVGKHFRYLTAKDDLIIRPLSGSLAANFELNNSSGELTGHEFVGSYLSSTRTGYLTTKEDKQVGSIRNHVALLVKEVFDELNASGYTKISVTGEKLPNSATQWDCVLDNETGLMWEKKTEDGGLRDQKHTYSWFEDASGYADPRDSFIPRNGFNTVPSYIEPYGYFCGNTLAKCNTRDFIKAVNSQTLCGYNDWRMPSKDELVMIGEKDDKDSFFEDNAYNDTWSGSPSAYNGSAWHVYFFDGHSDYYGKYKRDQVRAVRTAQ